MSAKWTNLDVLSSANHIFTCNLYKQAFQENSESNLFFSPFSVYTALSMTLLGTNSESSVQIRKCLNIQEDMPVHTILPLTIDSINRIGSTCIVNSLFINKCFEALPSFVDGLEKCYKAVLSKVDFTNEPEQAVLSVNNWVHNSTNGKISKLIDYVDPETALIILNAVHFKSFWAQQFEIKNTREEDFYLSKSNIIKSKLMYQSGKFRITHNDSANCDVLEIPYQDGMTCMLVFLPREIEGLQQIEDVFDADFLKAVISSFSRCSEVDVYLPTFKMEQSLPLKDCLIKMGLTDIFCPSKANLTGISKDETLYVSNVIHKSFIDINEEGTEAAAVTGVMVANYCARFNRLFRADHPFMFCILENSTKNVLFIGRLKNPSDN